MQSEDKRIQEHLDLGHHCALLCGTWLYYDWSYSKLLLRSHLVIGGNSYYVYSSEEFASLRRLLESGELDEHAAAELQLALADPTQQAITEFGIRRERCFYPGVVPISQWEDDVRGHNGDSILCWGESRFEAMMRGLLEFERLSISPFMCWDRGADPWFDLLVDVLEKLFVVLIDRDFEHPAIEAVYADKLGGPEGLRLFCEVAGVLLRSHLEDLGYKRVRQILECGVRLIWPDLDSVQSQDPAAVATAFLVVGSA